MATLVIHFQKSFRIVAPSAVRWCRPQSFSLSSAKIHSSLESLRFSSGSTLCVQTESLTPSPTGNRPASVACADPPPPGGCRDGQAVPGVLPQSSRRFPQTRLPAAPALGAGLRLRPFSPEAWHHQLLPPREAEAWLWHHGHTAHVGNGATALQSRPWLPSPKTGMGTDPQTGSSWFFPCLLAYSC